MELELGLALPNPRQQPLAVGGEFVGLVDGSSAGAYGKKRVFGDAFGAAKATLLPLFVPEDGDGGGGGDSDGGVDHDPTSNKTQEEEAGGVAAGEVCAQRSSGGGYVKVNMEGVAIGRKVDVSHHGSYQELLRTLERMFPSANQQAGAGADADADRAEEEEVGSHERRRRHPFVVTYEDGEGDWLLVGDDVPWEVFVKSVKRLKIFA